MSAGLGQLPSPQPAALGGGSAGADTVIGQRVIGQGIGQTFARYRAPGAKLTDHNRHAGVTFAGVLSRKEKR
jgi:hypothetical protein